MNSRNITAISLLALGLALSGCGTPGSLSGDIRDDIVAEEAASGGSQDSGGAVTPSLSELPREVDDERTASGSLLNQRLVYFDYDKSVIADEFLAVIEAHADYLLRYPDKFLLLEGHADSRGSNEYNLALGQRRSDAVRDIMLARGVGGAQMESLSFGEERPRAQGENEAAWEENRRVEIRYQDE